jgi:tRNA modification GTPase
MWVVDAAAGGEIPVETLAQEFPETKKWLIWSKVDLVSPLRIKSLRSIIHRLDYRCYFISSETGTGFDELLPALSSHAADFLGSTEPALVTRERQRRALEETSASLRRALAADAGREEIIAEELRLAARALGRLLGQVDVEDILDVIFRDFCIGK